MLFGKCFYFVRYQQVLEFERERERALEKAILQTVYGWNYLWAWGNGYILDSILDMIQRNHPFVGKKDEWNLI